MKDQVKGREDERAKCEAVPPFVRCHRVDENETRPCALTPTQKPALRVSQHTKGVCQVIVSSHKLIPRRSKHSERGLLKGRARRFPSAPHDIDRSAKIGHGS